MEDKGKIKVCVGLSGGVDSSVAAWLLKEEGYDVFAMFMQNWHDADSTLHGDCEWEEDRFVAEMVARKIGIPFYFVDLSRQYRQRVVDYMFDEYAKGRTPNPDVLCNREIKFDAFLQVALKYGADFVATGHYCRREEIPGQAGDDKGQAGNDRERAGGTIYRILEGTDPNKDQTYFLCQLSQEQLAKALFPIGHLTKPEVRRLAKEADLPSAEKKDSQGICFVGKVDLPTFLKQKLASVEGNIVEVFDAYYATDSLYQWQQQMLGGLLKAGETLERTVRYAPEEKVLTTDGEPLGTCPFQEDKVGELSDRELQKLATPLTYNLTFETETYRSGKHHIKKTRYKANPYGIIAGTHEGAQFYTIGQRKGLGVGGHAEPVFVIATDTESNTVYVGEGHHHKGLSRFCLHIGREEVHWIRPDLKMQPGEQRRYRVRIRYRQPLQSATLLCREDGLYILFDQPQRGISPGQFAVWYQGEEMLGSGPIDR
ncbi:MAG: tRNA 2-thiouridine(34) synthase MnmA [Bacteroidales bacterium]|nr:tRNA 2-thiouridine(34) synthase MnmA [Bacteroidales bacterium]